MVVIIIGVISFKAIPMVLKSEKIEIPMEYWASIREFLLSTVVDMTGVSFFNN